MKASLNLHVDQSLNFQLKRVGFSIHNNMSKIPYIDILSYKKFMIVTYGISQNRYSQHTVLGHHRLASETPFKWCFAGGPMKARF